MPTDCARCPLRKLDTFEELKGDELAFMRKFKVGDLVIDKGTPILMQGSNSPQLYTVLRGMGLRYKILPNGRRQVVNFIMPGDFIGLQAGVMGEMQTSIEATTKMHLCVFDRSGIWSLFRQQPARAYDLTWLAALQEHFLGEALASVGQMTAEQRICWALLTFHARCEDVNIADGEACPLPYTQQDLADALGLSLVHTNKTLGALRKKQILAWQDGKMRILNRAKATEIAMHDDAHVKTRPLI